MKRKQIFCTSFV